MVKAARNGRQGESRRTPMIVPSRVASTIELKPSKSVSSNPPMTPSVASSPHSNRPQFAAGHTRSNCIVYLPHQDREDLAPSEVLGDTRAQKMTEAGDEEADGSVDHRHCGERFHAAKEKDVDVLILIGEFGDADRHRQGRIFDDGDRFVDNRRQCYPDRLVQDDALE